MATGFAAGVAPGWSGGAAFAGVDVPAGFDAFFCCSAGAGEGAGSDLTVAGLAASVAAGGGCSAVNHRFKAGSNPEFGAGAGLDALLVATLVPGVGLPAGVELGFGAVDDAGAAAAAFPAGFGVVLTAAGAASGD
jgi:hypothetical protein